MIKRQVVNELHKPARKNYKRRSVILKGIDDLWQADLIDFKNIKQHNRGFCYILVVIDCFSKYAWTVPLKSKSKTEVSLALQNILKISNRSPINLQTDLGTEFYNDQFSKLMKTGNINHYSTFSTKKASIVERLIKTLKNNIYKIFNLNGNYKWIGNTLHDVTMSYNNSVHRTIRCKPSEVDFTNEQKIKHNILKSRKLKPCKKQKFQVGDYVRISKYKNCFQKGYTPNWTTEIFKIIKVNETIPVTYSIEDQRRQQILGTFYEQELQKTNYPDIYLIEKVLKKKNNKLFVKWLGLENTENSWIDKNNVVK